MTGRQNVQVTVVAPSHDDLTRAARELSERGLGVESEELIRHHYFRPFNHFGVGDVSGGRAGTYDV